MKVNKMIPYLFVAVFSVVIFRAWFISAYQAPDARSGMRGDGYSDINAMSAAHYFLDSGFTKSHLLPVHHYYPKTDTLLASAYTHYPALPDVLAGVYATLFNNADEKVLRIIPVILAMLFFFFIYAVLKEFGLSKEQAFWGAAPLWVANYFIGFADNLHQHLYAEVLKWLYTLLLFRYFENGQKGLWPWLLLIMAIETNISFEMPVYLGILTLGFSVVYRKGVFSFENITAFLAVVIGFGLHVWQNALHLGSWHAAAEDLTGSLLYRTAGKDSGMNVIEKVITWQDYLLVPFNAFNRMERFFAFPGWALLVAFLLVRTKIIAQQPKLYKLLLPLFIASISWAYLMAQHALVHSFTNKHFSTWYALTAAMVLPLYFVEVKNTFKEKKKDSWSFIFS